MTHKPALSDFVNALLADVPVQLRIANAARLGTARKREAKYVIKDQLIKDTLSAAVYNTDIQILELMYELGIFMRGYVTELYDRRPLPTHSDSEEDEENDENQEVNIVD